MTHRENRFFESRVPICATRVALGTMILSLMGLTTNALAQVGERQVTDLTETELTTEVLVNALRPEIEPPPLARSMRKPTCARFHQQTSRGIRPAPVSENIAITVEFESDSATLTHRASQVLDTLGKALQDPSLENCCFRVEGHTDSQHTEAHNRRLSEARAQSVANYLNQHFGVEIDQLLQDSFGESQPLAPNETAEGRQKNRRVQVTTLGYRAVEGGP